MNLLNDMRIHTLFLFHSGKRRKLLLRPAKIAAYALLCLCGDLLLVNAGEASFADNNSAVYNRVIYIAFISNGAKHGADIKLCSGQGQAVHVDQEEVCGHAFGNLSNVIASEDSCASAGGNL